MVTLCLDTSKCIEKKDLVDLIILKKKSSNLEKERKYIESNNKKSSSYAKKKKQVDVMKVCGLIATRQALRIYRVILTALIFTN